jgi:TPR repeat protein
MINAVDARASDRTDPWDRIELDPAICALAEEAAAKARLSLTEWLERAIRRASSSAALPVAPATDAAEETPPSPDLLPSADEGKDLVTLDEPLPAAILGDDEDEAGDDDAALPYPATSKPLQRWAILAAGALLAIVAGATSAQYLIPAPANVVQVALAPPTAAESPSATTTAPGEAAPATPRSSPVIVPPTPVPALPSSAANAPTAPPSADNAPAETAAPTASVAAAPQAAARKPAAEKRAARPSGKLAKAEPAEAPSDPRQLAHWLETHAEDGDPVARYRLGVLYALGEGVTQDYEHAAGLFKTAAEEGVTEAEYNIAVMYAEGLGIKRDPAQAVFWYRKAAAQGSASAAFNLGVAYSNGVGVDQSMSEAAQWFGKAAEAGVVNAQFNLGLLYERGEGVAASPVEAYAWYAAAASRGDSGAEQRRDHLAGTLTPAVLKQAQIRAAQLQDSIATSATPGASAAATPLPAPKP